MIHIDLKRAVIRHDIIIWCGVLAGLSFIFALRALFPYQNDDISHYFIARDVWINPWNLINFWGKPAFTLVHALPAQINFLSCRLTSVGLSCLAAWSAVLISRQLGLKHALLAFVLVFLQPVFFELSFSVLTETVAAVIIGLAVYLFIKERYISSSLLFSVLPLARPEGFFICLMVGCWYLGFLYSDFAKSRSYRSITPWITRSVLLSTGALFWNFLGYIKTSDPLWLINENTYAGKGTGYYGSGNWYDYLTSMPEYLGLLFIPFFIAGVYFSFQKKDDARQLKLLFIVSLWLFFFLLQSILWTFGLFKTGGYTRFFVTVSPLMGVITLYGLNFVLSRYPHKPKKFINTLVISSAVFMLAISDWGQTSDDYSSFMKMDNFYREYVAKHGRPGKVFCEYNYFDFLHDIETNADWRPKFNKQQLEKAEPGSLVLWVYPYERKKTDIEPDYFFSKQTIARGKELSQGKQNYLHLIHTARPPWRELADFSAEESLDDESPFIQKVFIKE